jgi:hypothetical protein
MESPWGPGMQIDIEFEQNEADFAASQVARLFCDIERLIVFAMALAHDDLRSDIDLFGDQFARYDDLLFADRFKSGAYPPEHVVLVKHLRLSSPLSIRVGVYFKGFGKALEGIVKIFEAIITADHIRRRAELDNIAKEDSIIRRRLEAYEEGLRLAQRISDPEKRAAFEKNLESALHPFIDGSYPPVKRLRPTSGLPRIGR